MSNLSLIHIYGTTYTGEWKKDAINGKGECRTSDGSVLSGKFKKYSLKNGTYTYTDGKQMCIRDRLCIHMG